MLLVPLRASFLSCFILLGCPAPGAILVTRLVCGWRGQARAWSSAAARWAHFLHLCCDPRRISPHISPSPRSTCPLRLICTGFFRNGSSNLAIWSIQHQKILEIGEYSIDIRHSKSLVQYWWLTGTKIIVGCAAKQDGAYYYLLDRILIQT